MSTAQEKRPVPATSDPQNSDVLRWWHPWIWHGFDLFIWLRLLRLNQFRVGWRTFHVAVIIGLFGIFNTLFRWMQSLIYGRRIRETKIEHPPIFIIGHWRSGTTMLHEMLVLDERHNFPTTYECFAPHHALLTSGIVTRWFNWVAPARRPMDNMAFGWTRPQEDEFALCALGQPSPYLKIAFPNGPAEWDRWLDLEGATPAEEEAWKTTLLRFMQTVTVRENKPIVLKSPPHTARIRYLLELFPNARFVHVVRDPARVFPSTKKLWKSLWEGQGLQVPDLSQLDEYVFSNFNRMYAAYNRDQHLIPPDQFSEVKYEELVADPVSELRRIYEELNLGGWEELQPALNEHLEGFGDYQTNRFRMDAELQQKINARWGDFTQKYGYDRSGETPPEPHTA